MEHARPVATGVRWWAAPRFWLGAILSAGAAYLIVRDVQWPLVAQALDQADLALLLVAVASFPVTNWAKAVRWRLLFYPEHSKLTIGKCHSILYVGQLLNSALPLRLGELSRAYLIGNSGGVGKLFALATAVVEKAMDSVMLLLLIAVLSALVPLPPWLRRSSLIVSATLAAGLAAVILLASQHARIVALLRNWSLRRSALAFLNVLKGLVEATAKLQALRDALVQFQLWAWSAAIWALSVLTDTLVLRAMHISIGPAAAPLLLAVHIAGGIVPTSPMQLGIHHYLTIMTLALFGVEYNTSVGFAVILHLVVYLPTAIVGAVALWAENRSVLRSGRGTSP